MIGKILKNWYKIITIGILLFIPLTVGAISGACSSHNGVNCSAGRQINGNVYCNDGWIGSIAEYDFMTDCQSYNFSCNTAEWNNLSQKYNLDALFSQLQTIIDNSNTNYFFQTQYNIAKSQYDSAFSLAERDCKALGADRAYSKEYERLKLELYNDQIQAEQDKLAQLKQQELDITKNYFDELNRLNASACLSIPNSTLVGNNCVCNTGYSYYNDYPNKCITPTESCKLKYGDHMYASGTKCLCDAGYIWDGIKCDIVKIQSTPTPTPTANSTPIFTPTPTPVIMSTPSLDPTPKPVIKKQIPKPTIKPLPSPAPNPTSEIKSTMEIKTIAENPASKEEIKNNTIVETPKIQEKSNQTQEEGVFTKISNYFKNASSKIWGWFN